MSKADFFKQLRERLRGLPMEEQQNIIRVYEDLFQQAERNGKSEREIIESLGFQPTAPYPPAPAPSQAQGYTQEQPYNHNYAYGPPASHAPESLRPPASTTEKGLRMVVAAIALGLFNLIFILGPAVGIAAVLFSLSVVSAVFTFSPVWIVLGSGIPGTTDTLLLMLFSCLAFTGLGVLLGTGLWKVNGLILRLLKHYIGLNLKLIKGE